MLIKPMQRLAELRTDGLVPDLPTWFFVGDEYAQPEWWRFGDAGVEVVIDSSMPVARIDLRPIVGLKVCVMASDWSDRLNAVLERLKQYAACVEVFVISWLPDSIGIRWIRGQADDWSQIADPFGREVSA